MNHSGMTLIVKNTARLVTGFIAVFAAYIALTGHVTPGGGFAGGVILAAAGVLVVLAFGADEARGLLSENRCHVWDAAGAAGFLLIALLGYLLASKSGERVFFSNFLGRGTPTELASGGIIPLANLAILVKVGAGLAGVFLALAAFRLVRAGGEEA